MVRLLACRFCRELFRTEEAERCPVCGLELEPLHRLPPSPDVLAEGAAADAATPAEDRMLPWTHIGHGRGALAATAFLGMMAFFLPWVRQELPYEASLSGFDLARRGAGWLWGGAVGWFILLPLVLSRRSQFKMRGVRPIASVFALLTTLEVCALVLLPPRGNPRVPYAWSWDFGLFASAVLGLVGALLARGFGGRAAPVSAQCTTSASCTQRPPGKTLH